MRNLVYFLPISILVIMLDQITKYFAVKYLVYHVPVEINRFFNVTLDYNQGAAFSFLSNFGGWQRWLFSGIALIVSGVIIFYLKNNHKNTLFSTSLAFILGGALGNLIDRVNAGVVTDFIQWHIGQYYWPTFNIADSAVCIGAVLFIIASRKS